MSLLEASKEMNENSYELMDISIRLLNFLGLPDQSTPERSAENCEFDTFLANTNSNMIETIARLKVIADRMGVHDLPRPSPNKEINIPNPAATHKLPRY